MSDGLMRANASEARAVDRGDPVDWSDPKIASRPLTEYLEFPDRPYHTLDGGCERAGVMHSFSRPLSKTYENSPGTPLNTQTEHF